MIAIKVVFARTDIPAAEALAIETVEIEAADKVAPVVLGDVSAVRELPGLVLDLRSVTVEGERRKGLVLDVGAAVREGLVVKAQEGSKDAKDRQVTVHEVLVRAGKVVEDDPVDVSLVGAEADVDVVLALSHDLSGDEVEVGFAIYSRYQLRRFSMSGLEKEVPHYSQRNDQQLLR